MPRGKIQREDHRDCMQETLRSSLLQSGRCGYDKIINSGSGSQNVKRSWIYEKFYGSGYHFSAFWTGIPFILTGMTQESWKVLLIGYGQRILDDILPTVATNGQLLDTTLHITLASSNPSQCVDTLLQKVPYLPHFSAISCMNKRVSESEMEDNRCTLSFEKAQLTAGHAAACRGTQRLSVCHHFNRNR